MLELARQGRARQRLFARRTPIERGTAIEDGWIVDRREDRPAPPVRLVPLDAIHLLGPHLVSDVMAAATVGAIAGGAPAAMTAAVESFRGLEHAMELVAEIGGVRFVNDSKATNVEAALRSIESFDAGLVPIIGGRFKGGDLRLLREPLAARAKAVVAIGEARPLLREALEGAVRRCARRRRSTARSSGIRAGEARGRGAAGAGVRELRHVSRLRGARTEVQGGCVETDVSGEQSSVGRRVEGLAAGNAGCPGLRSWCLHPRLTDDC